jgi:hypothetical protein
MRSSVPANIADVRKLTNLDYVEERFRSANFNRPRKDLSERGRRCGRPLGPTFEN